MIKCTDKGKWTCVGRNGVPKKSFPDDKSAINSAKIINEKYPQPDSKKVAYKCSHCGKYHLLTVKKKKNRIWKENWRQ
jgi:hypothetical protein